MSGLFKGVFKLGVSKAKVVRAERRERKCRHDDDPSMWIVIADVPARTVYRCSRCKKTTHTDKVTG